MFSTKWLMLVCTTFGSFVGGYGVVLFGVDPFSFWSIITGAIGGIIGIWVGWKLSQYLV
jgi:hypothetical protein